MSYLNKNFGLEGQTAVITGGGGVLCGAIAKAYANAGANVILWDKRTDAMKDKAGQISEDCGNNAKIKYVTVDLLDETSIKDAVEESIKLFGKIDILVNGVGGNSKKCDLIDVDQKDFDFVLKLNLLAGCVLPTKHVAKYWIANNIKGCIVNIASMAGYVPLSGVWAYSAAKAAVINQTMAFAKEFAGSGIRVNAIAPGFFVADQNRRLLLNDDGSLTQRGKDVIAHTPMGRFGEPDDLAAAAIFLASEGAGFVTGITLPIDGGYLCQNI